MRPAALLLILLGCGAADPPPRATPPAGSPTDDPRYTVTARAWLMAGDGFTAADPYRVTVDAPAGTRFVDLWIDGGAGVRLARGGDGRFHADAATPPTGEHGAVFAADGGPAFAARRFTVSAALYAVVSTDWDTSDNPDEFIVDIESLRQRHPRLRMTQFFAPYVFTDPSVPADRKARSLAWITRQRDEFVDEIGLHIHPWCNFVSTATLNGAPVACRTQRSFRDPGGDASGYTVIVSDYTRDEQAAMMRAAIALFEQHGLGTPTSFRTGGWTADQSTLAALAATGFTADSSAFPPDDIQAVYGGLLLGSWTKEHWGKITATSQPYFPSQSDQQAADPAPRWPVLEVPDNGCLVDYMTAQAMDAVLAANWAGGALDGPRVYQVGLHPTSFNAGFLAELDAALATVDAHLYADDAGPIRYARIVDLTHVRR